MDATIHELLDLIGRWVHVIAGIMWIGHLYFFNFVNGPFQGTMDGETKKKVNPELLPRAAVNGGRLHSEGSFIDAEIVLEGRRQGLQLREFPLTYFPRTLGQSTLSRPAVIFGIVREAARYISRTAASAEAGKLPVHQLWRFGASVLSVLAALALVLMLQAFPVLFPLAFFLPAVLLVGWRFGRGPGLLAALLALLVIAVVLPTGLSMMLKSIDGDALTQSAEGRAALNRLTYAAAKEFFPVGAGLGSYSIAFQRFQNAQLPGYVEHAHNDYLQLLFELGGSGLIVLALLIVATLITARTCYRAWRASGQLASFAFACLSGVVAFSFHAWFDFPAHIPALAWVVTMLAVASTRPDMQPINLADQSTVSRRRRKRPPSGPSDDPSPTSATT